MKKLVTEKLTKGEYDLKITEKGKCVRWFRLIKRKSHWALIFNGGILLEKKLKSEIIKEVKKFQGTI